MSGSKPSFWRRHAWNKRVSVILVPEGGARTFSLQLPLALGIGAAVVAVVLFGATITLFFSQAKLLFASRENAQLQRKVKLLEVELEKVRTIEQHLMYSEKMRAEVLTLLAARGEKLDSLEVEEGWSAAGFEPDEIHLRQQDFLRSVPSAWPARGPVTREFASPGDTDHPYHPGIDIAAAAGSTVMAAGAGSVIFAGMHPEYGNLLIIDHGLGLETQYAHNAELNVKAGDRVQRGQPIATVGSTGNSSAPHLHFEVHKDGVPVDPRKYLD